MDKQILFNIYIYIELHDKVQMKGFRYILDGKVNFLRLGWFFMCECVIYIFLQRGGWRSSKLIVLLLLVFLWLFSYTTFHSNHFYAWGDGCKCFFLMSYSSYMIVNCMYNRIIGTSHCIIVSFCMSLICTKCRKHCVETCVKNVHKFFKL